MPDHRRYCPWCWTDQRADWVLADIEGVGPHPDKATAPFWRTEDVRIPDVYRGVLFWRCPDCGGSWHAWPAGHRLHTAAEQYVGPPKQTEPEPETWHNRMGLAARISAAEKEY
jgi:hypothetical protein